MRDGDAVPARVQAGLGVPEADIAHDAALGRHEDMIRSLDDRAQQLRAEVAALTERVSFSQTENLANAPRIQLIERAVSPLTRSSPKMVLNLAMGFVAGCALAACALLLLGPAPASAQEVETHSATTAETAPEPAASPKTPPRRRWLARC